MRWETPAFVEIKMDAEIGSYQDDFGDPPDILPLQAGLMTSEAESENVKPVEAT